MFLWKNQYIFRLFYFSELNILMLVLQPKFYCISVLLFANNINIEISFLQYVKQVIELCANVHVHHFFLY